MEKMITIDTGTGTLIDEPPQALQLFNEHSPLLKEVMPEYNGKLPNKDMTKLVKNLKFTRKLYSGVGLSANQCGIKARVFVLGTDDYDLVCINPKIVKRSEDIVKDKEGCLSFPGLFANVDRSSWVEVEFKDEGGNLKTMKVDGVTARCFEHELDHLNGVRFVDHLGPVALKLARQKQQKLIKRTVRSKNH
jgi:peptide deformylase